MLASYTYLSLGCVFFPRWSPGQVFQPDFQFPSRLSNGYFLQKYNTVKPVIIFSVIKYKYHKYGILNSYSSQVKMAFNKDNNVASYL